MGFPPGTLKGLVGNNRGGEEDGKGRNSGREEVRRARRYIHYTSGGGGSTAIKGGGQARDSRHANEQTAELVGSRVQASETSKRRMGQMEERDSQMAIS